MRIWCDLVTAIFHCKAWGAYHLHIGISGTGTLHLIWIQQLDEKTSVGVNVVETVFEIWVLGFKVE